MLNMMRHCLDWRLLAALAVVIGGLALVAPGLLWAAVPPLLLAICPLMLLAMGVGGLVMARKKTTAHQGDYPVVSDALAETRAA